jgi:hypothetical protein
MFHDPGSTRPDRYSDDQVIDTVTGLLLGGLRG